MPFNYNEYSSLLLVVIAPAMLYAGLLLYRGWKQETGSDLIVGTLVFLFATQCTAWMLGFAGYYDQSWKTVFMFYFPWSHAYLYGALVYLFFLSLTEQNFKLWRRPNWYHLVPGLFFLAFQIVTIAYDFLVLRVHTLDIEPNNLSDVPGLMLNCTPGWLYVPLEILELLSQIGYFVFTLLLYRRYRSYLQTEFSNDELVHLRWLRNFLVFFLLLIVGTNVIDILSDSIEGLTTYEVNWWGFLLYGLIAYYLGFQAYDNNPEAYRKIDFRAYGNGLGRQRNTRGDKITGRSEDFKIPAKPDDSVRPLADRSADQSIGQISTEKSHIQLFQTIETTLRDRQLYLEPTLTLHELAEAVYHSSSEVSAAINAEAGNNFNFYINAWRVKDVQAKLLNPDYGHLSLLGIGLDAGFSSKATFNRAFKQHTGQTPRQFQQAGRNKQQPV